MEGTVFHYDLVFRQDSCAEYLNAMQISRDSGQVYMNAIRRYVVGVR